MEQSQHGVFKLSKNVKPIAKGDLAEFEKEMSDNAIPEIIREVEKRRLLAADSRLRKLEVPSTDNDETLKK